MYIYIYIYIYSPGLELDVHGRPLALLGRQAILDLELLARALRDVADLGHVGA